MVVAAAAAAVGGGSSGSNGLAAAYGPGGLGPAAIQGLEWSRVASKTPVGLLKTQCAHLWQEMQSECLLLLAELLRANLKAGGSGAGPAR